MRLLFSSHGANLYGAERVVLALAGGFAARGHEVFLEIPHRGPIDESAAGIAGVELVYSDRLKPPAGAARALRYAVCAPNAVADLRRVIRSRTVDLVWVNSLVNPLAAFAARLARVPTLWHVHERCFGGIAGWVADNVVGTVDLVLAVSNFVADSYSRTLRGGRLQVLPNALLSCMEAAPLREPAAEFVIGCLGQLTPRKRVHDLVLAMVELPDVRAVVVGDGRDRPMIERLARELGVGARVQLHGFHSDVRSFYAQVDCVVIPAVDEPFGLVALEAMAAGRPVVASRSGALPEVLGDAALYYSPGSSGELAQQVDLLRRSPDLAQDLRARGLKRMAMFPVDSWLDRAEQFAHLAVAAGR